MLGKLSCAAETDTHLSYRSTATCPPSPPFHSKLSIKGYLLPSQATPSPIRFLSLPGAEALEKQQRDSAPVSNALIWIVTQYSTTTIKITSAGVVLFHN